MIQAHKTKGKANIYDSISNDKRLNLIQMVNNQCMLKDAAKTLNMNYSTAKTILRVYKKEKRILRKYPSKTDERKEDEEKLQFDKLNAIRDCILLSAEKARLNYTIKKYNYILSTLSNFMCKLYQINSEF